MPANVGNQTITIIHMAPANSPIVNKRQKGIIKTGIYSGGYLSVVDVSHASLSTLIAEITDGTHQVRLETADAVNLAVASATSYVILRWAYTGSTSDFAEILAVASGSITENDLVVGRCTFDGGGNLNGFNYSDAAHPRTMPDVMDLFLKVEPTGEIELRVRIRGGRIQRASSVVDIPDQKSDLFVPPTANKKIYLVYVNISTGAIVIDSSGSEAAIPTAPAYAGRLVLAEVKLSTGDTSITVDKIKDVRGWLVEPAIPDGVMLEKDSDGKLTAKRCFRDYILIRDVKASGADGGTFTSGAWRTRDLTEETSDAGGHAGLGGNQITLGAGVYEFCIKCPASDGTSEIGLHQARLYNITDASVVAYGSSEWSDVSGYVTTSSVIVGKFTITGTKVFRVEHRCQKTVTSSGFGKACNFGGNEVYTIAEFWKVA